LGCELEALTTKMETRRMVNLDFGIGNVNPYVIYIYLVQPPDLQSRQTVSQPGNIAGAIEHEA
jgi:hypothetical protein